MGLDTASRHSANPSAPAAGFSTLYPFGASDGAVVYRFIRADGTVVNLATIEGLPTFADAEVPTGTINGSNAVFTLAHAPSPAASLILVLNGAVQTKGGVDYTLSGLTITYVNAPATGMAHEAWYRY